MSTKKFTTRHGIDANYQDIVSANNVSTNTLTALVSTGTAPLSITSTTKVDNLNVDLLDSYHAAISNTANTVVVRDANTFISLNGIYMNSSEGLKRIAWNDTYSTYDMQLLDGVTLQVGQESHIYGRATETIQNGQVVMFAGAQGDGLLLRVANTQISGFEPKWIVGVATQTIPQNNWGYVTWFGKVNDVDTYNYSLGDVLYLNNSVAGGLSNTRPTAPNYAVSLAAVVRKSNSPSSNNGILMVRPDFGASLSELHDVNINGISNNNVLIYSSANNRWENKTQAEITSGDSDKLDGQHGSYYTGYTDTANTNNLIYTNNAISSNVNLLAGVDLTQNTSISIIQGVDNTQNTNISNLTTWLNSNNTLQTGINTTQNTNITSVTTAAQAAFIHANSAFNNSNTKFSSSGGTISGSVDIAGSLIVEGNFTVSGNVTTVSANNLVVRDNMIYLNEGTSGNSNPDLGIAGAYNDGTYRHAGFFRDATDGVWKVFDQYLPEPDASPYIDTSNSSFRIASFQANTITGTLFSGSGASLTSIPNSSLVNSSVTVNGTAISLGSSGTVTAAAGTLTGTTLASGVTASSLTSVGTITSGTWSGSFGAVSGANLTGLTAGNLSGTIPSGVLGNSTHYVGTTAIALNRASASQTLTGISIDGNAATATNVAWSGITSKPAVISNLLDSTWAGGGGYHGYQYSGGNWRFGFSSTSGVIDVYADGNFYATDSSHLVLHAGNYNSYAMPAGSSATNSVDVRAPIFYDSNNTGYYIDPNSTSNILNFTLGGTQYFPSGSGGATFSSNHYSMGKDVANGSWSHPHYADLIIGYHTGIRIGAYYSGIRFYNNSPTTDANNDGNGDGGEALLMTIGGHAGGTGVIVNNTLTAGADVRAPIFYDTADTAYYSDPASTSRFNRIDPNEIYNNGWFRNQETNEGMYNQATGNHWYSSASNYWDTGQSGSGGIRLRNGHQGTVLGYYYGDTSLNSGLLNQNGDWKVRVNGSDIELYNYCYANDFRPYIIYDRNDTGYYLDPNGTTKVNLLKTTNWLYLDNNYGHSIVGVYSSTIFQGVFAMGDSYKLTAAGGINNLYGMCWSYPSAGGIAANLDSHGMIVAINGGFGSCMSYSIKASGNVTAYSDERLKKNWGPMPENFVARLAKVKVGTYDRMDGERLRQVGVSAQSLRPLLPEAVIEANDDIKTLSVSYGNAAMASAVELAKEIIQLKDQINLLTERLNKMGC